MTGKNDKVARCRIMMDGYLILGENALTVSDPGVPAGYSLAWSFPFGIAGQQHFIMVEVRFTDR